MTCDITCPACGFNQTLTLDVLPARASRATCPECAHRFPWTRPGTENIISARREVWLLNPALRRGLQLCLGGVLLFVVLFTLGLVLAARELPRVVMVVMVTMPAVMLLISFPFALWRLRTPLYELTPEYFTSYFYPFSIGRCRTPRARILGVTTREQTRLGIKLRQVSLLLGGGGERLREMKIDLMRSERPEELTQRLGQCFPPLTAAALTGAGLLPPATGAEVEHHGIIISRDGLALPDMLIPWAEVRGVTSAGLVVSGYGELVVSYGSVASPKTVKIPPRTSAEFVTFVRTLLAHVPQATIDPAVARIVDCPPTEARQETVVWLALVVGVIVSGFAAQLTGQYATSLTGKLILALLALLGGMLPASIGLTLAASRFYGWQPRTPAALKWAAGGSCLPLLILLIFFGCAPSAWQMLQGDRAMNRGDVIAAERYFRAALAEAPENHEARHALGLAYLEQKNYPEAFTCFETIYRAGGRLGMERIPEILLRLKRYDEALAWCDRISADHPRNQRLLQELGGWRQQIDRQRQAPRPLPPAPAN